MTMHPFSRAAASIADLVRAAVVAAWPRSAVRYEVARLDEEGQLRGTTCEMAFSVCIDDASSAGKAAFAVRAAGFLVDASQAARGFLTARTPVVLGHFALAREVTRLERAVRASGGFVEVIGPVRAPQPERATHTPTPAHGTAFV